MRGIPSAVAAVLVLTWGFSWNIKRTRAISSTVLPGLPLPPLCTRFPKFLNCCYHRMMGFRDGGLLCIVLRTHLWVTVTDWFCMNCPRISAFFEQIKVFCPQSSGSQDNWIKWLKIFLTFVILIEPYLTVTLSFATPLSFLTKSQAKTVHGPDFYFHGKIKICHLRTLRRKSNPMGHHTSQV